MTLDRGDERMIEIADAIKEGSTSFFKRVYGTIGKLALPIAITLFVVYSTRASTVEKEDVSHLTTAFIVALTFLLGAACSTAAGFIGLWVSVRVNVRVSAAAKALVAKTPTPHPISVAILGGAVASTVVISLVVLGVAILFSLLVLFFPQVPVHRVPLLLAGYGFGASFVALFAQLGGGIFTKAADVGADLVGKLEKGIPEDDHRNPAVIADLVGDNVGDCAARGADLFESIAAEIISSMILGGALASASKLEPGESWGFIIFPLVVHAFDLIVSAIGVFAATRATQGGNAELSPMAILKRGQRVALAFAVIGLSIATRAFLFVEQAPNAWMSFFACALVGVATGNISIWIAEYYTDVPYGPVQSIVKASETGAATNIIGGLSVGMTSTGPSTLLVGAAVLASFWIGEASGLVAENGLPLGGLYGTAVATMGALSSAAYVLSMDVFGPISDNAGGICEMSNQPDAVRDITDRLDAVGNSTKAATKAFALSTATLACFLLLRAFMDEVKLFSLATKDFTSVDLTLPEVFVAGLVGSSVVFVFAGMAVRAVGVAAGEVVIEVRRQFQEIPGIMEGKNKPEYGICVDIVAKAALNLMVKPGILALSSPIIVGLFFRVVGTMKGDPLMGPRAIVGFLVFNTATGILLGLFLSNAGGAWDNAKKAVEAGSHGGKGSSTHQACVVGDTVGDPLKDTAGPSLHVVIKLVSTVVLVLAPFFVGE